LPVLVLLGGLDQAPGQRDPELNTDGIPYKWIDGAPAIGVVRAVNPGFGFAVIGLSRDATPNLQRGLTLGIRRDGVIVIWGVVDTLEDARTLVLELKGNAFAPDGSSLARVGDSVIIYPPEPPVAPK